MRLQIDPRYPTPYQVAQGVDRLNNGQVICYPTDSVYALGCHAGQKRAVDSLYRIARKPDSKLLTLMCRDLSEASRYAMLDDRSYRFIKRLLSEPYCFILRATKEAPRHTMSKRRTVGIRLAHHPVVHALVEQLGLPLLSTSATWEGEIMTDPKEIESRFKEASLIYDVGLGRSEPSTVIDLTSEEPKLLRQGLGIVQDWL